MDPGRVCCLICPDLLEDPVIIPCGRNYCMNCIHIYWDKEDQKPTHSCPQHRQTFTPRPVLVRKVTLAELVEELQKAGNVDCDFGNEKKLNAIKSRLHCVVSYSEQHLHVDALKKHKLINPSKKLKEIVYSRRNEVMKIFSCTD